MLIEELLNHGFSLGFRKRIKAFLALENSPHLCLVDGAAVVTIELFELLLHERQSFGTGLSSIFCHLL